MRFGDLRDYFALRRHLSSPWRFLELRERPSPGSFEDVRFRSGTVARIRSGTLDRHILHRIFARDEYRLNGVAAGSWGAVIDVGAHIGLFALRVAPLAARVLAYEPSPANRELLLQNTSALPHVTVSGRGVGGNPGRRALFVSADPAAHSLHPLRGRRGEATLEVDCVSLEQVFAEHALDACDLLKLDCEGAEYEVLGAVPRALWPRIRRIALEYHALPGGDGEWSGPRLAAFLGARGHRARLHPSRKDPGRGLLFSELSGV